MIGRREAQSTVDKYQRLACFEAVKRNKAVTPEDVSRWCILPMADVMRHLDALRHQGMVDEAGGVFQPA